MRHPQSQKKFWSGSSSMTSTKGEQLTTQYSPPTHLIQLIIAAVTTAKSPLSSDSVVNWLIIPTAAGCSYPMLPKQLYLIPLWTFLPSKSPGLKTISILDVSRNSGLVGLVSQNMEHWHTPRLNPVIGSTVLFTHLEQKHPSHCRGNMRTF